MKYFLVISILLSAAAAYPLDLNRLINNGPVITINRDDKGSLKSVSVISIINAPVDIIWKTISDIDAYSSFMKRVVKSKITRREGNEIDAEFEIDVPFTNTAYTLRHVFNREKMRISVFRIAGDLKDSRWEWEFYPEKKRTVIVYRGTMKNYPSVLERFDDETSTISIGVNISSLLTTIKAIRERSEQLANERNN